MTTPKALTVLRHHAALRQGADLPDLDAATLRAALAQAIKALEAIAEPEVATHCPGCDRRLGRAQLDRAIFAGAAPAPHKCACGRALVVRLDRQSRYIIDRATRRGAATVTNI